MDHPPPRWVRVRSGGGRTGDAVGHWWSSGVRYRLTGGRRRERDGDTTLRATLLALFSGAALLLAVIGVYGAVSATVRQRWHELGVRLAVGASPARLRQRVVRDVLRVVTIGTAAGLLGAFWGSRAVGAFLFGVSARDPVVFTGVALVLTMLALLAAWVPANRVVRLNVVDVLRGD